MLSRGGWRRALVFWRWSAPVPPSESFSNFQQTMAQVQGITRATTREFEALNAQALDLGRNTRFSSQQVAEGQLLLARAGLGIQEIVAALPGTLQLAQAAAVSVGESADIVTNALASFREGADQTCAVC